MNRDGELRSWGGADFARGLVEFANIEVIGGVQTVAQAFARLEEVFGPRPYTYWGRNPDDYSPDVTGKILRAARAPRAPVEAAVLHLVGAAAPHARTSRPR